MTDNLHPPALAPIGFIGLGTMGQPMARNLARSGVPLTVWNRSPERTAPLRDAGATVASSAAALVAASDIVFLMLRDAAAIDAVLETARPDLAERLRGRTIVNSATISTADSQRLEASIREAGGAYVEAPVSGSRHPAETGQLLAMLAGDADAVARVQPLLAALCRTTVVCGAVPSALTMKFAVNIFLIASITGLAEAAQFAMASGLDLSLWSRLVDASQMASDISRLKTNKLRAGDVTAEAAISNVLETNRLVAEAAAGLGIPAPLTQASLRLYRRAAALGLGEADMIAVVRAFSETALPTLNAPQA